MEDDDIVEEGLLFGLLRPSILKTPGFELLVGVIDWAGTNNLRVVWVHARNTAQKGYYYMCVAPSAAGILQRS